MVVKGVDYSWARPGGGAIKAAGFAFAVRYVNYAGAQGKGLTESELADLHTNGIAVALVYESTAARPLDGFAAGVADAQQSLAQMRALGFPEHRPVYFAIDFDAQPHQFPSIEDYFRGCGSVLTATRVGAYGGTLPLRHLKAKGLAWWLWQALGWDRGEVEGRHLYQSANEKSINGHAVDWNEAYAVDFGQHPLPEEEPMGLSDDDMLAIFGSTERYPQGHPQAGQLLPKAERLVFAKARYEAAIATGRSVLEVAGDALSKAGKVPPGTRLTIIGEVTTK